MSHKVHPGAFRIKDNSSWLSRWLNKKRFSQNLEEDFKIREYLQKRIGKLGVEKIEIERFAGKIMVIISSARPGLIIGRGGGGVEELKKELEVFLTKEKPVKALAQASKREIKIDIKEIKDPWSSAALAAQWAAQQIERRMPYRRVLKQSIEKIMSAKGAEGCRVEMAGRLNGVEIARTAWLMKGRLPRQSLRADIDYAEARAYCTYGVIGIKVWIYKGERFA